MKKRIQTPPQKKPPLFQGLVSLLFCLTIPLVGWTQESRSFSLQQAQEFAIEYSYDAQKSQLALIAAQKKIRETVGAGLPQVNSSIGYTNNLELTTVLIPDFFNDPNDKIAVQFGTQHNANANLQIQQLVFNGSYFVGLATSRIYKRLATEGLERTQLDVLETVSQTYYLILVSKESQKIIQGNLNNLEKTLYEIRERYKEGFLEETDADVIQISVTSLKNTLQNLLKQTETAYQLLKFQMGVDLAEEIELTDSLENMITAQEIEQALNGRFRLEDNIDFQLIQTQEKLAEMNFKNEKAQYWPSVAAFYSLAYMAQRNHFSIFQFQRKMVPLSNHWGDINIPLFKSGAQKARVQQASVALDQARTTTRQVSQGLLLEETQAINNLSSAYETYLNLQG